MLRHSLKHHKPFLILFLLIVGIMNGVLLSGCGAGTSSSVSIANGGLTYEKEEEGVSVCLSIDKDKYDVGEELKYDISVTNNKKGYTISSITAKASNSEEFKEIGAPEFKGMLSYGESVDYEGTLVAFTDVEGDPEAKGVSAPTGVTKVTIRPYVKVNYGGQELTVRYIVEILMYQDKLEIASEDKVNNKTVSCHDPSIVVGTDKEGKKCYYIFGSHLSWAKSYDLENWVSFTNNINAHYQSIFAEPKKWSAHGSSNYPLTGYMWAPDVIYNTTMNKWCMYMSIDGDNWYSSIVLLTADEVEGDWEYQGIVVYSGFRTADYYDETDVAKATGETTIASRYTDKKWGDYYPNNIDACTFYDDDGNLYMSYGSWSGGIFLLELDEETGLRDYSVTYENSIHSDPYFGKKIAGGKYVSGEGSYIQKIGDYYYLFMSYGNLEAKGGYNVRVFRSERPDGDYVDALGNDPYYDTYVFNYNLPIGERLFGGYKWRSQSVAQVAQGHNSAFVDDDGRAYMVFHTRTSDGSEGHFVKVHQLFVNKNGYLVAAPYRTSGEKLDATMNRVEEVAGDYDLIIHNLDIDYASYEVNTPVSITLNEDGTISGEYEGTWSIEDGTSYITLEFNSDVYEGVVLKQCIEDTTVETVVFTAVGDSTQITIWGSRIPE